jgi:hypothetical protein
MEIIEKTAAPRKKGRNPKFNKAVLASSIRFFQWLKGPFMIQ